MATYLYRIGRWSYTNRFKMIGIWVLVLVGMGVAAATLSGPTSNTFTIPGIPSERAQTKLVEKFPDKVKFTEDISVRYTIKAPDGQNLTDPRYQQAINTLVEQAKKIDDVKNPETIINPFTAPVPATPPSKDLLAFGPINEQATAAQIQVSLNKTTPSDVTERTHQQIDNVAKEARKSGLTVEMTGLALKLPKIEATSELIGVAVAIVVMIVTFGSFVAWGMPLITALIGLTIGVLGITTATGFVDLARETPILATMIGLAVGIDYALFIVSRYRHELRKNSDPAEAAGRAVGTAGSAVVFAGLTVLIALAALSVVKIPFLTAMGLSAAGTVFVAVLVALTLLPAVLGLFGTKAFAGTVPGVNPPDTDRRVEREAQGRLGAAHRFVGRVIKHPGVALVLAVVVLGVIAGPMVNLKLALPDDGFNDPSTTQRKAYDIVSDEFGAGRNGVIAVVADGSKVADPQQRVQAYERLVTEVKALKNVRAVLIAPTDVTANKDTAVITIEPTTGPSSDATHDLVSDIRDQEASFTQATGVTYGVTGQTAIADDVSQRLADSLAPYLAIVVGLAFILLVAVFRSILVPLTAALGFLLSVVATFGATVAVFQEGHLGLTGNPQPIVSFLPIFLIGIVFGLAMDYQVFLVTRMREAYVHGASPTEAVREGFTHGARVVTAAALIMTSVFAAFVLQENTLIKSMGFALAAAVVFDAFLVRMVAIPAALSLMGDKAWWIPTWLDRILPDVDVEGDKLNRYLETRNGAVSQREDDRVQV
ncbi:MMPL family transporter [Williamsia sp. CHRR-6]|uniref:MMPL family transporter n=1 Tax=Williamsia sp. CHRR-6 TaxID=2835871 RepID=UPI001BDA860B|nr:MMPL family transporter [Williamsia sp. CHRR-6]MBT0567392.1 MMPL family transporter [Williamsia sp. CHRR-6]